MEHFIITVHFGIQIRSALVQYDSDARYKRVHQFSIHPKVKNSGYFVAYDTGKYVFESDFPTWLKEKRTPRPRYQLTKGEIKNIQFINAIIEAVDKWVSHNLK